MTKRETELANQVQRMTAELERLRKRNGLLFTALQESAPERIDTSNGPNAGQVLPRSKA